MVKVFRKNLEFLLKGISDFPVLEGGKIQKL